MAEASSFGETDPPTTGNSSKMISMEEGSTNGLTGENTMENGRKIKWTVKGSSHGKMEGKHQLTNIVDVIKEPTWTIRNMVMVNFIGQMDVPIEVTGLTVSNMVEVSTEEAIAKNEKENGSTDKRQDGSMNEI